MRRASVNRAVEERGSAVVDFVLVGALLTVFCMSVIQLMLILHVRNTLIDAAASGARYGSLADRTSSDAEARTAELITSALNPGFAQDITTSEVDMDGIRTLEVSVRAPMPVLGLLGPGGSMEVRGHAALAG
ncbi:TadE/TadG family type IV pilus assembly protein [Paenarthrobacter sp. NPDC057355]|uniref:TadE/TadG family type IV pilus assembly protein n=1 Tax=Paenarthrobacter sp. NPDC057355 TaxID=3346105 RepID=UPI00362B4938